MYFACFQNMSIKVTPNFEKYGKCLKIFANTNSKCTCIREILPYARGMKVVLGPCIHRKLYVSSREVASLVRLARLARIARLVRLGWLGYAWLVR